MLTLTITERAHSLGIRYVVECDGVQTHMLNSESLGWHLKNKLMLTQEQTNEVFTEINNQGAATLELVKVEQAMSAVS